jgi:hypothetical protein
LRKKDFRLLYHVAADVLPVQASAVPCERIFSSGKETDTLRRNSLSPFMTEVLQILKFKYKSDRLSFANGWIASAQELDILDEEPDVLHEFLRQGKIKDLSSLVTSTLSIADTYAEEVESDWIDDEM